MIKYYFAVLVMSFSTMVFGQDVLNNYSYVVVPEQYDFLEGKDRYQLNSMTRFYLEKHGFNAYMAGKVPNFKRCDGLYADVVKNRAFLRTDLQIIFKDCNGSIVFEGPEGRSKFKEFRKAYQVALREALSAMETMGVRQPKVLPDAETNEIAAVEKESTTPVVTTNTDSETNTEEADQQNMSPMPSSKFSEYSRNDTSYLLRQKGEIFILYKKSDMDSSGFIEVGTLLKTENGLQLKDMKGASYDVYFDENDNMTIFRDQGPETYTITKN
ncbi:hypothetical protein [Luteirhabdus pelagi]|uniref:hypothetical protein n=1 Tax=Luteirhabdus pelagi TaxID=2792783 RepID=UPI0019393B4F|nr:hypothetical protein [Luteirhabdus pelagi]